ncbi:MAG: hypothetical protein ACQESC_04800 [Nanobdellota archaeon]
MALQDKSEELYKKKNEKLDLNRDVEPFAMWSFILSLAPIAIIVVPFINLVLVATPFASIVTGIIGIRKCNKNTKKYKGKGFAIAGLVIGLVEILIGVLAIILFVTITQNEIVSVLNNSLLR